MLQQDIRELNILFLPMKVRHQFQCALITGASSGIGCAIAELLAKKNIPLIISGRNEQKLEEIAKKLQTHVPIKIIVAELSIPLDQENLIKILKKDLPDLIINNAGFGIYGPTLDSSYVEQQKILEVNAIAPFHITFELAKTLISQKKTGVILNISSVAADMPFPFLNLYASSKIFLNHFSLALAEELKNSCVSILTAAPGQVNTEFSKRAAKKNIKDFSQVGLMSPEYAAKKLWRQIELRKSYYVFDWRYRLTSFLVRRCIPYNFLKRYLVKSIKKRIK